MTSISGGKYKTVGQWQKAQEPVSSTGEKPKKGESTIPRKTRRKGRQRVNDPFAPKESKEFRKATKIKKTDRW